MKKKTVVMLISAVVMAIPLGLLAHHGAGMGQERGHGQMGMRHNMIMSQLDLSEQQREQMKEEHTEQQKKLIQLRADLQIAQLELKTLIADGASESAVNRQVNQVADAQKNMLQTKSLHQLWVREILGAEKFEQMMNLHHQGPRHGQGHARMGRGQSDRMQQRGMMQRQQN